MLRAGYRFSRLAWTIPSLAMAGPIRLSTIITWYFKIIAKNANDVKRTRFWFAHKMK